MGTANYIRHKQSKFSFLSKFFSATKRGFTIFFLVLLLPVKDSTILFLVQWLRLLCFALVFAVKIDLLVLRCLIQLSFNLTFFPFLRFQ